MACVSNAMKLWSTDDNKSSLEKDLVPKRPKLELKKGLWFENICCLPLIAKAQGRTPTSLSALLPQDVSNSKSL